jgi:1,4-dihydroxy-2-naphthoate octaprenyltransferase
MNYTPSPPPSTSTEPAAPRNTKPHGSGPTALVWLRMTRPAFLLLTVVACVLGTATAAACGCGLDLPLALGLGAILIGIVVAVNAVAFLLKDAAARRYG